jgi:polyadenylate-binding protein
MQLENIKRELTFKAGDKVAARNMLGEILYPLVLRRSGQATAGKITGMLLELTTQEVLTLLEDPVSMDNKIVEAQNVLNTSGQKRGP